MTTTEVIRRVVEACPQLPEARLGFVAVHSHHALTEELLKFQFDALKKSNPVLTKDLAGVLVIPQAFMTHAPETLFVGKSIDPISKLFKEKSFRH